MSIHIRYTLCSEGPSDRVLLRHIDWALSRLTELPFIGEWADPSVFEDRRRDIASRVAQTVALYPCNLLFLHRDGDADGFAARREEVRDGLRAAGIAIASVAIVPVRMTESWLLCDERAIRRAAGRPRARNELPLPSVRSIESQADPKDLFERCLAGASGCSGRRLEAFRRQIPALRYRVAELIEDFTPLLEISAFQEFYRELEVALVEAGFR